MEKIQEIMHVFMYFLYLVPIFSPNDIIVEMGLLYTF